MRLVSRIGYPKENEFEGENFEWLFDCETRVPFFDWFCKNIHETNVFSPEELKRLVQLFASVLIFIPRKLNMRPN